MIIDPYKYLHTGKFLEHAMLHAVTEATKNDPEFVENKLKKVEEGEEKGKILPFDMTLTIAGQEVDITDFFEHVEKEFKRGIKHEANELVKEKYHDKLRMVYGHLQVIEDFLGKQVNDIVPEEERS
jgi:hypothetical protein